MKNSLIRIVKSSEGEVIIDKNERLSVLNQDQNAFDNESVLKNNKVIDILDNLIYLKWDDKHKIMVLSDENNAQAVLSSDKETIWHEETLYRVPVGGFDTVRVEPIDQFEYKQLKMYFDNIPYVEE